MSRLTHLISAILLFISTATYATADDVPLTFKDLPDFTIAKGQVIYQRYCIFCHGKKGKGDGPNSFSLPKRPADLSAIVPERNNEQLLTVIQQGGAARKLSPAMASFKHTLSDRQIIHLIRYLRKLPQEK